MTCPTCEIATLVEVLERKGILTKQEVLDMIQELRQREPTDMLPRFPCHLTVATQLLKER